MANLDKSAVKVTNTRFRDLGRTVSRNVKVTLTGQGTTANAITAASCGLSKFRGLSYFTKDDNSAVVIGAPSVDGSKLLLKAAATNAPADYSGDFIGVINGISN